MKLYNAINKNYLFQLLIFVHALMYLYKALLVHLLSRITRYLMIYSYHTTLINLEKDRL